MVNEEKMKRKKVKDILILLVRFEEYA